MVGCCENKELGVLGSVNIFVLDSRLLNLSAGYSEYETEVVGL